MPDDLAPLRRLLAHLLATDPDRFWVASAPSAGDGGDGGSSGSRRRTVRDGLWFLAMLFVRPGLQARRHRPGAHGPRAGRAATWTRAGRRSRGPDDPLDSRHPHLGHVHRRGRSRSRTACTRGAGWCRASRSGGCSARCGAGPRVPPLPAALEAVPFEAVARDGPDGHAAPRGRSWTTSTARSSAPRTRRTTRSCAGTAGSGSWSANAGAAASHGYVYGSGGGRLGPVAALDPALHPALHRDGGPRDAGARRGRAVGARAPRTVATRALLDAGLRIDGFPGLVCWSRADHPFERYLPISLALV